jgi:cytidine deaminase
LVGSSVRTLRPGLWTGHCVARGEEHMSAASDAEIVTRLLAQARQAREHAYAPYSGFQVGAALLTRVGTVFHGCNVENASYGLCCCAERTAMFTAVAAGCTPGQITHLAVVADTQEPVSPCGACRQVMIELGGPDLVVIQGNLHGATAQGSAAQLLPGAFELRR